MATAAQNPSGDEVHSFNFVNKKFKKILVLHNFSIVHFKIGHFLEITAA
jgi:hypothetical protein